MLFYGIDRIILNKMAQNISSKFTCTPCDFICSKQCDWNRHLITRKHICRTKNEPIEPKNADSKYLCDHCGKKYNARNSLWYHNKKCIPAIEILPELTNHFVPTPVPTLAPTLAPTPVPTPAINHDLMYEMFKELCATNNEFKQMLLDQQNKMMELSSKIGSNNNSNNNTQVNVNMFLNEYCKDAVTLTKFIESIKPSFEDVMYMSDKGNVAGLTKILKTALGGLAITDRPLHCTDVKRHTTWVKEADGWQKDQEQANLKRLCNKVEHACLIKTMDIIQGDENYLIDGTAEYDHVHKMMLEAGGGAERHAHNIPIVVRNIEENIKLDKEQIQEAVK